MNEQNGVRWEYISTYRPDSLEHPNAVRCADCERWFVATHYRGDGDGSYCPECKPVESIAHSMQETLDNVDPEDRPRDLVSVEEL